MKAENLQQKAGGRGQEAGEKASSTEIYCIDFILHPDPVNDFAVLFLTYLDHF